MKRLSLVRTAAWVLCSVGWTTPAFAQAGLQIPIEFDFLNPGARSLALGSAFTGLADDATAAFTNPAGLTALVSPEVSLEGRARRTRTRFLMGGRLSGRLSSTGVDTVTGAQYGNSASNTFGPGFVSFVYPRTRFAVAAYRHELTSFDQQFESQGVFQLQRPGNFEIRELPLRADRTIDVVNYGVSAAARVTDTVSLGVGLSFYDFQFDSLFERFIVPGAITNASSFTPSTKVADAVQAGDDTSVAVNLGLLVRLSPRFQFGAAFRQGPDFHFQITESDRVETTSVRSGRFRVPDALGVGFVARPIAPVMITADYVRVRYGSLRNFVAAQAELSERRDQFGIEDGNEFHLGVEYVFTNTRMTPALRGGTWYDPAHSVTYTPTKAQDSVDERFSAYLPGADAQIHTTFGGGISVSSKLEVNVGADLASRRKFFSLSAIARF